MEVGHWGNLIVTTEEGMVVLTDRHDPTYRVALLTPDAKTWARFFRHGGNPQELAAMLVTAMGAADDYMATGRRSHD